MSRPGGGAARRLRPIPAGAVEAAFCWLALAHREDGALPLPPHVGDGVRDPELAPIALAGVGDRAATGDGEALVMSNSFGFGGNNCVLVLGAEA